MAEIGNATTLDASMSRGERKAHTTDQAFRTIVAKEDAARDRKTAHLRALRMEQEAVKETEPPKKKASRKK